MDQSIYRFKITNPELKEEIINFATYYVYSDYLWENQYLHFDCAYQYKSYKFL